MVLIRFTASLTVSERDSLYLKNMGRIVVRYDEFVVKNRRNPSLQWFRRQLVLTESIPSFVTWAHDIDHIIPRKLGGVNEPDNLIVIPQTMNRSFNRFVDRDKIAFLGKTIFDSATEAMRNRLAPIEEANPFGAFAYSKPVPGR
tara:strand:- start:2103 stop:2534 length:432 start_codon:yes stop_codon:yes gene_type:complete